MSDQSGGAPTRLWGGRFGSGPSQALARLSVSVHFDWRLAPYDLAASRAHARVLHGAGLLDDAELRSHAGRPRRPRRGGPGRLVPADSRRRGRAHRPRTRPARAGRRAGRQAAGRDAAATTRSPPTCGSTCATRLGRSWPASRSSRPRWSGWPSGTAAPPMPGMTHLQHAQPVLLAHHLLAHVHALQAGRRAVARTGTTGRPCSPLGAGALAGSSLPLDPEAVAAELGFRGPIDNSIDAVSDRDFVAEFCFVAALLGVHLSRLGEEICLWATTEFGWVELDDAYATGSSIMPQKKNPDVAELARGKSGRLVGNLTGAAHDAQGPAAGLRPRPAGGQGAGVRLGRAAPAGAAGRRGHGGDPRHP